MRTFGLNVALASAVALVLVGLQPASAAVISYTNAAAFDAAVTGEATYDFTGIAPPLPGLGFAVVNPTVAGVTFTSNNIPFVIDTSFNPTYGVPFFSGQGNTPNSPPNSVNISLSGFKAFGFFYGSYVSANEPYSVALNTGDIFALSTAASAGSLNFFGVISDAFGLTSIDLTSTAGLNTLDANGDPLTPFGFAFDITQFKLANSTAVPEPITLSLFGAGLAGAVATRRRKKKTA